MTVEGPRMMTKEQVALYLQVSPDHVDILEDTGMLPGRIKLGRLVRWDRRAVDLALDRASGIERPSAQDAPEDEEAELMRRAARWAG